MKMVVGTPSTMVLVQANLVLTARQVLGAIKLERPTMQEVAPGVLSNVQLYNQQMRLFCWIFPIVTGMAITQLIGLM